MIDRAISVIIPAYNEGANIKRVIESVLAFLQGNFSAYEVIVVDDGSTDDTRAVLAAISHRSLKLISNGVNRGKGFSVKRGVETASLEYVLFCDADLSTPLEETAKFFRYFGEGYDIVVGSRAQPDSVLAVKQGIVRQSMGKTFNCLLQWLLFRGIKDTQCGFKCFKREHARSIFACQTIYGFCFDAEILYIAKRRGLRIKECGVKWANRSDSRVAIVADSLSMFLDLFRIRMNGMRGIYDTA
jgi:dolichyl-phosphate beta-glucosyltransferase